MGEVLNSSIVNGKNRCREAFYPYVSTWLDYDYQDPMWFSNIKGQEKKLALKNKVQFLGQFYGMKSSNSISLHCKQGRCLEMRWGFCRTQNHFHLRKIFTIVNLFVIFKSISPRVESSFSWNINHYQSVSYSDERRYIA
jgi:hypothetical protein